MQNVQSEIKFQTTRSGGKGGQNVNKVETAVIAYFNIEGSQLLDEKQKEILKHKLSNRINSEGELWVKSQTFRTQLENKEEAARKINELITSAHKNKKSRIATKIPKQVKQKRLDSKKRNAEIKSGRRKLGRGEY